MKRMISCRSVMRIHTFAKLTYTRECSFCHRNLSYRFTAKAGKVSSSVMDQKRRKGVTFEWRSVSTQASSSAVEVVKAQASSGDGETTEGIKIKGQNSNVQYRSDNQVGENDVSKLHIDDIKIQVGGESESANQQVSSPTLLKGSDNGGRCAGDSVTRNNSISMEVGASLMRFIKGRGGETQKKIEDELEVKLLFPSSRHEDSIVIEGKSAENVAAASEKLQTIIDEAVNSPNLDYSHFISLPLAIHPELVDKLLNFQNTILETTQLDQDDSMESNSNGEVKDSILDEAPGITVKLKAENISDHVTVDLSNIPLVTYKNKGPTSSGDNEKSSKLSELGIEKSIFIKPRTFHLTVLMLKLWNKDRIKAATEVLQSISSQVMDALDGRPVFIRLKGLQSMRGSLSKARVLYAPVEEVGDGDRLVRACQLITNAFVDAGLVLQKDERQKLMLHATIMNARHRKRKIRTSKVDTFDARGIMEQYGSKEWGEYLIREAHLSQRFAFDESGYYHCCASIPFPEG